MLPYVLRSYRQDAPLKTTASSYEHLYKPEKNLLNII
jgi:hypothetical protein